MKLLHLDSSITGTNSVSRTLSADIVAAHVAQYPSTEVTYHDLANEPLLHLSPAHLAAFQGRQPESAALGQDVAQGFQYLEELINADVVVIGAPMYNFGVPSQLKAWIDRVVVAGKTFRYSERGPEGLLSPTKKVYIAASTGGMYSGDSPAKALEHAVSYLKGVFGHIGLKDVTVIGAEGVNISPEVRQGALTKARRAIDVSLAARVAA